MNLTQAADLTRNDNFFKYWMPYLFQKIDSDVGKHCFLPLNRIYKPLGVYSREWVDYDSLGSSHGVIFTRDPSTLAGTWVHSDPEEGRYWLYEDAQNSRITYFSRLEMLMVKSLKVIGDVG